MKDQTEGVTKILKVIKEKFPHRENRIEQLYQEDENFQMLCRNYLTRLEAMIKYRHISNEQRENLREYKNIISELEIELSEFLSLSIRPGFFAYMRSLLPE